MQKKSSNRYFLPLLRCRLLTHESNSEVEIYFSEKVSVFITLIIHGRVKHEKQLSVQ
jgi:hypothetical protein